MKNFDRNDWENVQASGDFERLQAGGYVARILSAEDFPDKEYLLIIYDIAEGKYAGYYSDDFYKDKDYAHRYYASYKDTARGLFKAFYTAVEESNHNYIFEGDEKTLEGKLIGLILAEEEYIGNDGSVKTRLKVSSTKKTADIRDGKFRVPPLKELEKDTVEIADPLEAVDANIPF